MAGVVRIGTSGWVYPHWRERFYPKGLPQTRWLEYYSERFDTVELNNPFYCGVGAAHTPSSRRRRSRAVSAASSMR